MPVDAEQAYVLMNILKLHLDEDHTRKKHRQLRDKENGIQVCKCSLSRLTFAVFSRGS